MSERTIRVRLSVEELSLIEDALYYYRACTEANGPDDHTVPEIRHVERWIGRYVTRETASDQVGSLPSS